MPDFRYKIRDKSGKHPVIGHTEAKDLEALVNHLQEKGYLVTAADLDTRPKRVKADEKTLLNIKLPSGRGKKFHNGIKLDDITLFARQMATLLEAGVTLLKALEIIQEQLNSRRLYIITEQIKVDISAGLTLKDALAKHPRVFSTFWVNLVETGEASGHLSVALAHMAKYLETKGQLQRKIISALMYPLVLVVVVLAVLTVFMLKIVPIFESLYSSFNVTLPALTRTVIGMSKFVRHNFILVCLIIAGIVFVIRQYLRTPQGRWNFDKLILKVPIVGTLVSQLAISRFAGGLSTLIQSGVPILFALDIVGKSTGNKVIEKAVDEVRTSIKEGKSMAEPLKKSGYFPPMLVQMVSVGEEVGELGSMLDKVYAYYEERISTLLTRVTSLFEPVMLVFMGAIVGVLVISMYLPIFNLASTVRK